MVYRYELVSGEESTLRQGTPKGVLFSYREERVTMQRVLTFVHNKKKYVSKPWCFGAATLVEKEYMDVAEGEKVTATSVCADAVDYLFEGTEATQDILDTAVSAKMRMCREVMKWFMDDFTGKNEESLPKQATEKED